MGIAGLGAAIDKQQEKNSHARERLELRPLHLGTRKEVSAREDGNVTEREARFRAEVGSRKRKFESIQAGDGGVEEVEWSFKGGSFQDGVEWISAQLQNGDYVSNAVVDVSNFLVPHFAQLDKRYRQQILKDPHHSVLLLEERRHEELRFVASLADDLSRAFPQIKHIDFVYDNAVYRPVLKDVAGVSRMRRSTLSKGSRLSRKAINEFRENDGKEGNRGANLAKHGPPSIDMTDDDGALLPAFAPPREEEEIALYDVTPSQRRIAAEATKLLDNHNFYVSTAEADSICRDLRHFDLSIANDRIESYSLARNSPSTPIATAEFSAEWIDSIAKAEEEVLRGRSIICAVDSDHLALNDSTSFDFWFAWSTSRSRAIDFSKRALHPSDWNYSSFASSVMAMVLTGCDYTDGLPGYTIRGVGTSNSRTGGSSEHSQGEIELFDICENALEWRRAYYRSFESASTAVTINVRGEPITFYHSLELVEYFGKIVSRLFKPTSTKLTSDLNLHKAVAAFNTLYDGLHQELRPKEELLKVVEKEVQDRTNKELQARFCTPGARNHAFGSLDRPQQARPPRSGSSSAVPPLARRSRQSSLPRSWRSTDLNTDSRSAPPPPTLPRQRRNSFTDKAFVPLDHHAHRPYASRGGPDSTRFLQSLLAACDDLKVALSNAPAADDSTRKKPRITTKSTRKGKGKAVEANDQLDAGDKGEKSSGRAAAVGGGAKEFGLAVSTVTIPMRASSFNNLVFSTLPPSQEFNYAVPTFMIDLLNVWISEVPMTLDLVHLLMMLYIQYAPQLLTNMINRGGQKFGDIVATLVQRTAKYGDSHPLGDNLTIGDSYTFDQAPQWLKKKVDAIIEAVPVDRRTRLWELVDAMGFTEDDLKTFGNSKDFNLFGMITVKLRRLQQFPPPLLRLNALITRNFTVCGTALSNACMLRGQRIHRTAAAVVVDQLGDFAARFHLNAYGIDSSELSRLSSTLANFHSVRTDQESATLRLSKSLPSKKLKRVIAQRIYASALPDSAAIDNEPVLPLEDDEESDSSEEDDEEEEDSEMLTLEMLGDGDQLAPTDQNQFDADDADFKEEEEEVDEAMDLESQEEGDYDDFGSRIFQLVKNTAIHGGKSELSSDTANEAAHAVAKLLILSTDLSINLIGASFLEAVRSAPGGESLKKYKTIGELVVGGGGKSEDVKKNGSSPICEDENEEGEKEKEEEEEGEESTRFKKNVELSTLMRMSVELRSLVASSPVKFEPDGIHVTPTDVYTLVDPSNADYLPRRLEELVHRQETESRSFNDLLSNTSHSTVPPFSLPPQDSLSGSSLKAVGLVRSLVGSKEKKFMRDQAKHPNKILFPVLHDHPYLDYSESPSNGPLPIRAFTRRAQSQRREQATSIRAFFETLQIIGVDLKEIGHEIWRYLVKPDIGQKKIYHGGAYITRDKLSLLCLDTERYNSKGLSRVAADSPQLQGSRETFEASFSDHPRALQVYLKMEAARVAHFKATGEVELVKVKRFEEVEGSYSTSPTHISSGKLIRNVTPKRTCKIVPLVPLLRPLQADPAQPSTAKPRFVLRFSESLGPKASNPPPRLDDRKPKRLYLTSKYPSKEWKDWCKEHVEEPTRRRLAAVAEKEQTASSHSMPETSAFGAPPPSSNGPATNPAPSTSAVLLTRSSTSNVPRSTSSRPAPDLGIGTSRNPPPIEVTQDHAMDDNSEPSDWRREFVDWLKQTSNSSVVILASDRGRVYSLVTAALRVVPGHVEFYRTRTSGALLQERSWNSTLKETKPFEARVRLAEAVQDPQASSFSYDLSKVFARTASAIPSQPTILTRANIVSELRFTSQASFVPPPLQGAILHSPDYISSTLGFLERQRKKAEIDSNAGRQWSEILPRPKDGSRIPVAIIRSNAKLNDIAAVKGHGRDDSKAREEAMVHSVRSLDYVDLIVVECTESDSSQVCAMCRCTLIHPCFIGDPLFAKILRLYYCIRCMKMVHRDDNGALNIIAIALGIAIVGEANILSRKAAKSVGNSNRLSGRQTVILENQFHRTLLAMKEWERKDYLEGMKGRDLLEVLRLTRSSFAESEADAQLERDEDSRL